MHSSSGSMDPHTHASNHANNNSHASVFTHHVCNLANNQITHTKCSNISCDFNVDVNSKRCATRSRLPESRQFSGNIRGGTWNPRAFFARKGVKMNRRINKVRGLCAKVDFFGLQETHSTPERALALQHEFPEHVFFWSHCSQARGGLAICVSKKFLHQFSTAAWLEIQEGRVGKLELRGPNGSLDLITVYLDDQSSSARQTSFNLIQQHLAPRHAVLSVLFGDFNFVENHHDRWCKTSGHFTGNRDKVESQIFKDSVLQPAGLHELEQEFHTWEGGRSLARLDRVYTNWHTCDQLDRSIECAAASWPHNLSDHRPILFARRATCHKSSSKLVNKALPICVIQDPAWAGKGRDLHLSFMTQQQTKSAHMDLHLLKNQCGKSHPKCYQIRSPVKQPLMRISWLQVWHSCAALRGEM